MDFTTGVGVVVGLIVIIGFVGNFYYERGQKDKIATALKESLDKLEKDLNKKIDDHIRDNENDLERMKGQLQRQWDWEAKHEKETADYRLENQKSLGRLEAGIERHDGHYVELVRLIDSSTKILVTQMNKLEERVSEISRKS